MSFTGAVLTLIAELPLALVFGKKSNSAGIARESTASASTRDHLTGEAGAAPEGCCAK